MPALRWMVLIATLLAAACTGFIHEPDGESLDLGAQYVDAGAGGAGGHGGEPDAGAADDAFVNDPDAEGPGDSGLDADLDGGPDSGLDGGFDGGLDAGDMDVDGGDAGADGGGGVDGGDADVDAEMEPDGEAPDEPEM